MPTTDNATDHQQWDIDLTTKPDADTAMQRIYAWYEGEIIDRPPVRFTRHNYQYEVSGQYDSARWPTLKDFWFDEEYQVERYIQSIENKKFLGEGFPVFWPNLGPNVFASFYGIEMIFGEVTSWAEPIMDNLDHPLTLNWESDYLKKLDSLTRLALEMNDNKYLVGYSDLHPGLDWIAALRDGQKVCMDLYDHPEKLKTLLQQCSDDFLKLFNYYDDMLKENGQLSVTWMEIPSFGKLHIPSCDFGAMISPKQFEEFAFPYLARETATMTHNIFHLDGKGVANHTDMILELPRVQAIQWVQGMGDDLPIMQWVPYIKKLQQAGKSVVVDLNKFELDEFMQEMKPEGLLLCVATETEDEEIEIIKKLGKWKTH